MRPDFAPKNTGIMFKANMILAYLKGIKNQTRRVKGLAYINENPDDWQLIFKPEHAGVRFISFGHKKTNQVIHVNMPYGGKGDSLYFKETYKMWAESGEGFIHYRVDDAKVSPTWWTKEDWAKIHSGWFGKWNSSMFMPRRFSRFREVPIVNVRVERLTTISRADAFNEGVRTKDVLREPDWSDVDAYFRLWDSINRKTMPVQKNPWVWVYQFPNYQGAI